ncbi:unnamed protein product [Cuscuta epithymum]|uniref:25S rRNA (uridine-N(3))-methyltransferase BMT5-like domain-containing protein n=2 Tax=Cuscuta epithymum TaxID=186058 RepID=A0AAV0FF55_9ASTE|nr:unnamed protein product [Cuscuta epithymum]
MKKKSRRKLMMEKITQGLEAINAHEDDDEDWVMFSQDEDDYEEFVLFQQQMQLAATSQGLPRNTTSKLQGSVSKFGRLGKSVVEATPIRCAPKSVKQPLVLHFLAQGVEQWIRQYYRNCDKILVVGEVDFSFSSILASFGLASNMTATTLESHFFIKDYDKNALENIVTLRRKGCKVMHGVDPKYLADHSLLHGVVFERIVIILPFFGFPNLKSRTFRLRRHQFLVREFIENAMKLIDKNGEIHIAQRRIRGLRSEWEMIRAADFNVDDCLYTRFEFVTPSSSY